MDVVKQKLSGTENAVEKYEFKKIVKNELKWSNLSPKTTFLLESGVRIRSV